MSPNQARQEASRLFREGNSHKEIADHLSAAGYLSTRGKSLSTSGVGAMLVRAGKRRRAPYKGSAASAASPPTRAASGSDRLQAARSILGLKGIDPDEKLALISLVIGE